MFHTKHWFYVQVGFEHILQPFCSLHLNPLRTTYDNFIGEHIGIFKYVSNRHLSLFNSSELFNQRQERLEDSPLTIHNKTNKQTNKQTKQTKQKQTPYCILIDRRRKTKVTPFSNSPLLEQAFFFKSPMYLCDIAIIQPFWKECVPSLEKI